MTGNVVAAAVTLSRCVGFALEAWAQQKRKNYIRFRKANQQVVNWHMRPLAAMAKGQQPMDSAEATRRVNIVATLAPDFTQAVTMQRSKRGSKMRSIVRTMGVVIAACVAGFMSVGLSHAAEGEQVIKARIDFMDVEVFGQFKVLAAFAKDGKGSLADVEKSAKALASFSKKIAGHFPKDTGRGNFPDTMTRALPVIWTDWPGFEKEVQRLTEGSERLARLASAGDRDAVVALIGPTGSYARTKMGCAECHDAFRGAQAKK